MTAYLALFRGINVGGNQKILMADLKALHASLGFRDVATYIQSGNVVFRSEDDAAELATRIEASIATTLGLRVAVIVRTPAAMQAVIDRNPFQDQPERDPKRLAVIFLRDCPNASAQADLLTAYAGPEEIHISDSELYVYYPDGMGHTKLTNTLIEKKLKTVGTARNWSTTLKLLEMLRALNAPAT